MKKVIYLRIVSYLNQQDFGAIIIAHSLGVNINYENDKIISIKIKNVIQNHKELLHKHIEINLTSEHPIEGDLTGYINGEADLIRFIR